MLTGGELGALVLIDAVSRLIPGVLGSEESSGDESFSRGGGPASGLLEYPQYTRPSEFRGLGVPEPLLGGDHAEIVKWRRAKALELTRRRRPDLLESAALSDGDRACLAALEARERLTAALDAAGVPWTALEPHQAEQFERDWLAAFVPAENQKRARQKCLPRRTAAGGLEQAFRLGLIPGEAEGETALPAGPRVVFLPPFRAGVRVEGEVGTEIPVGAGLDCLLLTDAGLTATALLWKGKMFSAKRIETT